MAVAPKSVLGAACLCALCFSAAFAILSEDQRQEQRAQERAKREKAVAIELLHQTDLKPLYDQINRDSFDGQLSPDVPVSWDNVRSLPYCGTCGGMTDFDTGKPRIRIDNERVKSEYSLRFLMQHEMCHVAVYESGHTEPDMHGPLFQACLKQHFNRTGD